MATKITNDNIVNVDASKLTGSINANMLTGSLPAGMAPDPDLTPLQNDLAILALHHAIAENKSAHSLQNSWIEQFEDSSSITLTDTSRDGNEFISCIEGDHGISMGYQNNLANSVTPILNTLGAGALDIGGGSFTASGRTGYAWQQQSSNSSTSKGITIGGMSNATRSYSFWFKIIGNTDGYMADFRGHGGGVHSSFIATDYVNGAPGNSVNLSGMATDQWHHGVIIDAGTGITLGSRYALEHGVWYSNGLAIDNFEIYDGTLTSSQVATIMAYNGDLIGGGSANASGSFTSTTITPQDGANKSSLGLVLLYKDDEGTNTLNTDISAQVSADNGSNWSNCVLAPKGTFSAGIKTAIAPAVDVTSGNQLQYKVSFVNQELGTAEVPGSWETGNRTVNVTGSTSVNSGNYLNWVDGDTTASGSRAWYWQHGMTVDSSLWVKLDFDAVDGGTGATRTFTEFRYHTSGEADSGVWKWQGSNDDTNWTDIGSNWTMTMNSGWNTFSNTINNNTTAYRYYRILGVSGSTTAPWMTEIEFRVKGTAAVPGKIAQVHGVSLQY